MKNWMALIASVVIFTPPAHGGYPSITVRNIRNAGDIRNTNSAGAGGAFGPGVYGAMTYSNKIDFNHQVALEIDFRDIGETPKPNEFMVEWFFMAKDVKSRERRIFDSGSKAITLSEELIDATSMPLQEHHDRSIITSYVSTYPGGSTLVPVTAGGPAVVTGSKIEGWIVRLMQNGRVLTVVGSLSELEEWADSDNGRAKLDELMGLTTQVRN